MSDVTLILSKIEAGDPAAARELLPLVYDELRKLARAKMNNERGDHTLQATALVHEAYVRLVDTERTSGWNSRHHFFMAAAEAMRRILIESAKRRATLKRGGDRQRATEDEYLLPGNENSDQSLIELNELVDAFAELDSTAAALVKLHIFGGLSIEEAGATLGLSRSAAYSNWKYARAWFARHEQQAGDNAQPHKSS